MHTISEIGTNVPAFLGKLWKMVEDPETNDLISWSSTGTSFVIKDEIRFARELLPSYYKHNNMASFIRQLNMYGFHKIVSPDAGSMKLETPDEIKFTHPFFMQGHPYLLENIKRKIGVSKVMSGQGEKTPQVINKVLSDVRQVKSRQENLDSRLTGMKVENEALWRELSILRQKHLKQQQIVNKLIQFLVTIVQQNHSNFSVKRKYPRMLQHHDKPSKQKVTHPDEEPDNHCDSNSPKGPVIHELDPAEALLETVVEEVEADTSTGDPSDYFFNPEADNSTDEMDNLEVTKSMEPGDVDYISGETIIGLPEDTCEETIIGFPEDSLTYNSLQNRQRNDSYINNTRTRPTSKMYKPSKNMKTETDVLKPKYIKIVTKRPGKNRETKVKQLVVSDSRKQLERALQKQLQVNQHQLDINKQQIIKSGQKQLESQSINQPLQKKRIILPKLQLHVQTNSQQQLPKVQQGKSLEVAAGDVTKGKTQVKELQQEILLQRLQQNTQPLTSTPVTADIPAITTSYDSRAAENIVVAGNGTDLNTPLIDGKTDALNLPVPVEDQSLLTSPAHVSSLSPAALTPQDLLIGSPLLASDPIVTSPPDSHSGKMQVACVEEPATSTTNIVSRSAHHHLLSEMDNHIDSVQNDLDSLKELLRTEGISLDANTLLGYFNDDPLSYNMPETISHEEPKEISGNELMACNPSMFDFADLVSSDWNLLMSPGENLTAGEDSFAEVNTPQFVPQSPSFTLPSKKRKK